MLVGIEAPSLLSCGVYGFKNLRAFNLLASAESERRGLGSFRTPFLTGLPSAQENNELNPEPG